MFFAERNVKLKKNNFSKFRYTIGINKMILVMKNGIKK